MTDKCLIAFVCLDTTVVVVKTSAQQKDAECFTYVSYASLDSFSSVRVNFSQPTTKHGLMPLLSGVEVS